MNKTHFHHTKHKSFARVLVIAFALSFILSACGGGGSEVSAPSPVEPTQPTTPPEVEPNPIDHSGLPPISSTTPETTEYYSGGDATVFVSNEDAFSTRPDMIKDDFQLDGFFTSGDHIFRTPHANAGPLLNTNNCQGCHLNDGRGVLPSSIDIPLTSTLVKIGDAFGQADRVYGTKF